MFTLVRYMLVLMIRFGSHVSDYNQKLWSSEMLKGRKSHSECKHCGYHYMNSLLCVVLCYMEKYCAFSYFLEEPLMAHRLLNLSNTAYSMLKKPLLDISFTWSTLSLVLDRIMYVNSTITNRGPQLEPAVLHATEQTMYVPNTVL